MEYPSDRGAWDFRGGHIGHFIDIRFVHPERRDQLSPISQQQSITIPVCASSDTKFVFISGSLPAHQTSAIVTITQIMAITSQGAVPNDKAEGIARFTTRPKSINDSCRDGDLYYHWLSVKFQTVNITHLPGGSKKFVEVPIAAMEAGSSGNVAASAISASTAALRFRLRSPIPIRRPEARN